MMASLLLDELSVSIDGATIVVVALLRNGG
jgi:hypothetical protein